MEIKEALIKKEKLEEDILVILRDFCKVTGLKITSVDLDYIFDRATYGIFSVNINAEL